MNVYRYVENATARGKKVITERVWKVWRTLRKDMTPLTTRLWFDSLVLALVLICSPPKPSILHKRLAHQSQKRIPIRNQTSRRGTIVQYIILLTVALSASHNHLHRKVFGKSAGKPYPVTDPSGSESAALGNSGLSKPSFPSRYNPIKRSSEWLRYSGGRRPRARGAY